MGSASWSRTAFSYVRNVVWSPSSACIVAVVVLAFLRPLADGPAVLPESTHQPETCRTCASSSPKARASVEAKLIAIGAIEAPSKRYRL
jgi:hypothetical protein